MHISTKKYYQKIISFGANYLKLGNFEKAVTVLGLSIYLISIFNKCRGTGTKHFLQSIY
jgi:hypothetical protein